MHIKVQAVNFAACTFFIVCLLFQSRERQVTIKKFN